MSTSANIVLDIQSPNPVLTTTEITSTISAAVSNNTIVNTIKTQLNASTNPTLQSLSTAVNINAESLTTAVKVIVPPVFVGPANYTNSNPVSILAGWFAGGDGTNKIIQSLDGNTWTKVTQTALVNSVDAFAYGQDQSGNKTLVAVGSGGSQVAYTTDNGFSWIRGSPVTIFGTYGRDVVYGRDENNKPIWYGVGANVVPLAYSYDGMNWISKGATIGGTNVLRGISYGNNQYIALGNNGINLSTDFGNTWTNVSSLTNQGRDAAYGTDINGIGRWIAVGTGSGIIAQSTNGSNWTAVPSASTYMSQGYAIAYGSDINGNQRWVLGGTGGQKMVYTNDCVTFTQCIGISNITTINGITCGIKINGEPLWVAVGNGTDNLLKSNDGITWTSFTDKTNLNTSTAVGVSCAINYYNKPIYLHYTPGSPTLSGSVDGATINVKLLSPFSTAINKIEWNGTIWIGVGEGGNTVAYSTNGVNWTGFGTSLFSTKGNNVVWNSSENKWYIYGQGTNTVLTSTNGIDWA